MDAVEHAPVVPHDEVAHRVHPWDLGEARVMKHTRVMGDPETEGVPATIS
jgi:hypothetical protein